VSHTCRRCLSVRPSLHLHIHASACRSVYLCEHLARGPSLRLSESQAFECHRIATSFGLSVRMMMTIRTSVSPSVTTTTDCRPTAWHHCTRLSASTARPPVCLSGGPTPALPLHTPAMLLFGLSIHRFARPHALPSACSIGGSVPSLLDTMAAASSRFTIALDRPPDEAPPAGLSVRDGTGAPGGVDELHRHASSGSNLEPVIEVGSICLPACLSSCLLCNALNTAQHSHLLDLVNMPAYLPGQLRPSLQPRICLSVC
jgi:hypothetical protein